MYAHEMNNIKVKLATIIIACISLFGITMPTAKAAVPTSGSYIIHSYTVCHPGYCCFYALYNTGYYTYFCNPSGHH